MKDYASATPFIPIIIQIYGSEICFRGAFFFFLQEKVWKLYMLPKPFIHYLVRKLKVNICKYIHKITQGVIC